MKNMRWLFETDLKKKKLNDNQTIVQVHIFHLSFATFFYHLFPLICILFSTSPYTQIYLLPKQNKVFFKTQTLLQQTCSVFQSDVTLHLCSLSLDILLSVLQTATVLRNEYVFHQYQGRYKTLSPSCNVPHCPLNIANSNPKQHKRQKPPDQKHFHYTLLKTSTYPSTILFCHSPFTTYKCI